MNTLIEANLMSLIITLIITCSLRRSYPNKWAELIIQRQTKIHKQEITLTATQSDPKRSILNQQCPTDMLDPLCLPIRRTNESHEHRHLKTQRERKRKKRGENLTKEFSVGNPYSSGIVTSPGTLGLL